MQLCELIWHNLKLSLNDDNSFISVIIFSALAILLTTHMAQDPMMATFLQLTATLFS
jgi:hypothetical protein